MLTHTNKGVTTPAEWVNGQVLAKSQRGIGYLATRFEDSIRSTALPLSTDDYTIEKANAWFTKLASVVDGHVWLFSNGLVPPEALLGSQESVALDHVKVYIERWALMKMEGPHFATLTPAELSTYQSKKTSVAIRIFKLANVLLDKLDAIPKAKQLFTSSAFYRLLLASILSPHMLGYNTNDTEQQRKLGALTLKLCRNLLNKLPPDNLAVRYKCAMLPIGILTPPHHRHSRN